MTDTADRLVAYPCFTRVPAAGEARAGGEAVLAANAGLVGVLALSNGGAPVGAGYQAPFTVPLGLATTAVLGALGAPDPSQASWTVREVDVRWHGTAKAGDDLEARARVDHVDARGAQVRAHTRGSASGPLLDVAMRVVPVSAGRYAPVGLALPAVPASVEGRAASAAAATPAPLLCLQAPRVVVAGNSAEVAFTPDLLRLLMHPVAGHPEPLGRRVHPLGNAPIGAALTAALVAAGEPDPWRPGAVRIVGARLTLYRALSLATGWTARAWRDPGGHRCRVEVAGEGAPLAVAGTVDWALA